MELQGISSFSLGLPEENWPAKHHVLYVKSGAD